ncbi:winged helix-turn-helix transcriptional regulator [Streptomyces sp. SID3343]|uniref:winged helix-turn-helix transcriptional regulator n=1 Tax=Streptomyces sp. SID3343 TaxID=2690260 RepID=UPI001367EBB5|nr:winged helix-turn-helix transcriptional regulator [Streptomyces sp. SID3343]MYV97307.1 hypothetical protein [Streptomyces sp. SID3343]
MPDLATRDLDTDQLDATRRTLDTLHPRWTMWCLHMLREAPATSGTVARSMRWISPSVISQRLSGMTARGLVAPVPDRPRGTVALTERARELVPAQEALAAWGRAHHPAVEPVPAAEHEERVVRLLRYAHTVPILAALRDGRSRSDSEIRHALPGGVSSVTLDNRLRHLQGNGVIHRTPQGCALTTAGYALTGVQDALAARPKRHGGAEARPVDAPTRSHAATNHRNGHRPVPPVLFSHPEGPWAPAATTPTAATVRTGRGR